MSSILKALKKLEEEKAIRKDEALDLPREILVSRRGKKSLAPVALGTAIIASLLLTIGVTTLIVTRKSDQPAPPAAAVTSTASGPDSATSGEPKREEVPPKDEPDRIRPALERPVAIPGEKPLIPYPAGNEPPTVPETLIRTEPRAVIKSVPSLPATASLPPAVQHGNKPAEAPKIIEPVETGLSVSGIAWNKDSAERLAIINGHPAATGTYVNGFIVEEILPDRVRFSSAGKTIEIHIGKSGKTD